MTYQIKWNEGCEPWFIVDRFLNPFYDSVFRGYGWNKITHLNNLNATGFTLWAHPGGFLVHRQHEVSQAGVMFKSQKKAYDQERKKGAADKAKYDKTLAGTTHR
jgi:glycosyltransferase-like protein LARGE